MRLPTSSQRRRPAWLPLGGPGQRAMTMCPLRPHTHSAPVPCFLQQASGSSCLAPEPMGHLPTHKIAENVEAVQVGVLTAPVHIASRDRLAQFVRVGENRQDVICREGRSWDELDGQPLPHNELGRWSESRGAREVRSPGGLELGAPRSQEGGRCLGLG